MRFSITFPGSFYSAVLYDRDGCEVFGLSSAINAANDVYGKEWKEVFNGEEGASNE